MHEGVRTADRRIPFPTSDFFVQKEERRWGREVPPPPMALFDVLIGLRDMGITSFEPMAIPKESSFYWTLMDMSRQPYSNDPAKFQRVLARLRDEKKVERYLKGSTRFGLSTDEIDKKVPNELLRLIDYNDPKLAQDLGNGTQLRLPTELEFRLLFTRNPGVLNKGRGEWLSTAFGERRMIGVRTKKNALSVVPENAGFFRSKHLGFRMVFVFPQ